MIDNRDDNNSDDIDEIEQKAVEISWKIPDWFPQMQRTHQIILKAYHSELLKFNKTVNLISQKTVPFADAIHFADSLMAMDIITKAYPNIDRIVDVGSGNGFPGLVFAIMQQQTEVVLMDTDMRKVEFLKHMVSYLKLSNAKVVRQSIETISDGQFKYAIARGYAPIGRALVVTRKAFPKGGVFFHLKGEEWVTEISQIPTQVCSLWAPSLMGQYKLPVGPMKFSVVKTEKLTDG